MITFDIVTRENYDINGTSLVIGQDKHQAPIDCSGVAGAAGHKWLCKHCCLVHRDKVSIRAGNECPQSFHNHGEGPY